MEPLHPPPTKKLRGSSRVCDCLMGLLFKSSYQVGNQPLKLQLALLFPDPMLRCLLGCVASWVLSVAAGDAWPRATPSLAISPSRSSTQPCCCSIRLWTSSEAALGDGLNRLASTSFLLSSAAAAGGFGAWEHEIAASEAS